MTISPTDITMLMKAIAVPIKQAIDEAVNPLAARITALEAGGIKFAGTWQRAMAYRRGTVTTADGAMWVALRDTGEGEQPGKAIDAWQLAEKSRRRVPAIMRKVP